MESVVQIYKKNGETPLEALENFRAEMASKEPARKKFWQTVSMTYAGRLDPMAEGVLMILIGEECKNKDKYLGFDKQYEVEIVFGISTDSHDALGLARIHDDKNFPMPDLSKYIGKFKQKYPAYSSKTVGGKQLHSLARTGELPEEMPEKEVEIYSIETLKVGGNDELGNNGELGKIDASKLKGRILSTINLVKGDFRQEEIKRRWNEVLPDTVKGSTRKFHIIKIVVNCSSGTYMRSLADRIGQDIGIGAFALSIKRIKIYSA